MRKDHFGFPIEDEPLPEKKGYVQPSVEKNTDLPGDFRFKVTSEPTSFEDETIPFSWAVGCLVGVGLWALVLFFGGFSVNAKVQLFSWSLFVGLIIYNARVYRFFGGDSSPLDEYVVPVGEEEEFRGEPLRITKWFRLVFSIAEAPVPEAEGELSEEEVERRGRSSFRVFLEWLILGGGLGWSVERGIAYTRPDGPYFYEIFAVHCVALLLGLFFWFVVWLYRRADDDWYTRRQHTEALNFLICRWFSMYLLIWFFILMIILD